jgi:cytochrome c biogenesis protein CcdA
MRAEEIRADDRSLGGLVRELIDETTLLIRQELRLVEAEGKEKLAQAQKGLLSMVSGLLLGFAALLVLLQALVIALAEAMPAWLASIAVGGVVALIGLALIVSGRNNLKPRNLTPERTIQSIRAVPEVVEEPRR